MHPLRSSSFDLLKDPTWYYIQPQPCLIPDSDCHDVRLQREVGGRGGCVNTTTCEPVWGAHGESSVPAGVWGFDRETVTASPAETGWRPHFFLTAVGGENNLLVPFLSVAFLS